MSESARIILTPEEKTSILRSAHGPSPDARLDAVLADFRTRWLHYTAVRWPRLRAEAEDLVQSALAKLMRRERLASLREPALLEHWARSLLVNTVLDHVRSAGRGPAGSSRDEGADAAFFERLPSHQPTPEEWASYRERVAIVEATVARIPAGRLRFLEDLPEREIMERTGASRDAVASQLRRLRAVLRSRLEE